MLFGKPLPGRPRILFAGLAAMLLVGGIVLASWDIPAPSGTVETIFDDARFPR